jgi:hypothetical protein
MVARKNAESFERPKAKAPDIFSHPAIDRRAAVGGINRSHKNMRCACSNYMGVRASAASSSAWQRLSMPTQIVWRR